MSADEPVHPEEAGAKIAAEICKARRITTEGVLNPTNLAIAAPKRRIPEKV